MLRVLQVVTTMNCGGLESVLMNYYRHVDRNQLQFDFLTHRPFDGFFGEEILKLGGKIYHLPALNPFSPAYRHALRGFFREHPEYQIIHVHLNCMSSVILKEASRCAVPVRIAHSHSSSQNKDYKYPIKLFYRRLIRKYATDLFACGQAAGQWMFHTNEFTVLKNAIEVDRFRFSSPTRTRVRRTLGFSDSEIVIGHVGSISPQKNHFFLISVFQKLLELRSGAKLLLVGNDSGKLAERIKSKCRKNELEDAVVFTGIRNDVADLMQAMDVFVLPSLYEGVPVTMIEAQAAGLPCVVSENVPKDCVITGLVSRLPLTWGPALWAEHVLQVLHNGTRPNTETFVKQAGFDIHNNAIWLQHFYPSKLETKENGINHRLDPNL